MLSSFAYDHDDCGNRTELTEATGDVTTYAYDALYELTGQTRRDSGDVVQYSYSYTYDDIGNRLTLTDQGSAVTTYTYNAGGQLTGTDASGTLTTYTYDASGNLSAEVTSAGTRSYTWDYDDRLTDIEYPDSSETNYTYNSAGQRLTKVEGGSTTKFVYDGAKVVLERDGDDETQVRYTHEGGSLYDDLLSQRRDGASYEYLLDGLASVKQIVDSSQAIENSYSYEAFGQPTVSQSDVANPYLFVGGYGVRWESTPSLYFMQARYYGPGVGRFLSEDPYGGAPQDPLSLHRYLYCVNGPVSRLDPSGRFLISAFIGIILIGVIVLFVSGCGVVKPPVETWPQYSSERCNRVWVEAEGGRGPSASYKYCEYARHCLWAVPGQNPSSEDSNWQKACFACCSARVEKQLNTGNIDDCDSDCRGLQAPRELPDVPLPEPHT